jgi:hypothetical protein
MGGPGVSGALRTRPRRQDLVILDPSQVTSGCDHLRPRTRPNSALKPTAMHVRAAGLCAFRLIHVGIATAPNASA